MVRGNGVLRIAVAAAAIAAAASAQQPRLVSTFDVDEEGWTAADADSSVGWNTEQPGTACDAVSGSVLATHGGPAAGSGRNFVPPICVGPVTPATLWSVRAQFRFPPGQDRTGSVRTVIVWTDGPNCTGLVVGSNNGTDVDTTTAGNWVAVASNPTAPAGAVSASVRVRVQKTEAGGDLELQFDEVEVVPGALLFLDGLENGSTCRWSSAVG